MTLNTTPSAARREAALKLNDPDIDAEEFCARFRLKNATALAAILMWISEPLFGRTSSLGEPEAHYRPFTDELAVAVTDLQDAARALINYNHSTMPGIARLALLDRFGPYVGSEVGDVLHDLAFFARQNPIDPHAPGSVRMIVQALAEFLQQEGALTFERLVEMSAYAMRGRWSATPAEIQLAARGLVERRPRSVSPA